MKVIVPCAGRSSRFPNMPPKWMLPDHDGLPMVVRALAGLNVNVDDVVFTLLREHEERFKASEGLERAFGRPVRSVILEKPTSSQSETVAETLMRANISGSFLVKDSDNYFEVEHLDESFNYVTVSSLHDFDLINARNKSYLQIDQDGIITNIREKQVISDLFSVGGYYFRNPSEFLHAYTELKEANIRRETELYVSEIIAFMILNGATFQAKRAVRYQDWGTVHEWRSELERRRVFLVSVDGFLFERGSSYFKPAFADVKPHTSAVETVQKMGQLQQTIIYLSIRPPELEQLTRTQLRRAGLPDGQIVFGCGVAQWSLVTAPHPSLPFSTSQSFEIDPDDSAIEDKLELLA